MNHDVPSSVAWYRDPDDPGRLRHWNGRTWDGRCRRVPPWTQGTAELRLHTGGGRRDTDPVLEGPVHPAALLAAATATAHAAGGGRNLLTRGRPSGPHHARRAGGASAHWPGEEGPDRRSQWWRPRVVMMSLCALVGVAVLVLAGTVGIAPRPDASNSLASNVGFVDAANRACGAAIVASRLQPSATISAGGTSTAASVAAVTQANANLGRLADRIRAIPLDAGDRTLIAGWLVTWSTFSSDRLRWAQDAAEVVPASGGQAATGQATSDADATSALLTDVDLDAAGADQFATANGLSNCTLTPSAAPLATT